jgi:uncharacterized protein (TIGR03437 family)
MSRIWVTCAVAILIASGPGEAQTIHPQIAITSAAGYQQGVAPNSLATLFGQGLSGSTISAKLGPGGQLPMQLAGVSVEVNGERAELIYVSPSQINFVVPADTPAAMATVVVRSATSPVTQSGTVIVQNVVPALFSLNSTGAGEGAIFNGVTYSPPPFLVLTPQNSASDKRTRLLVYATGLRYAGNPTHDPSITNVAAHVTAVGRDPSGDVIPLPVEYAGRLPVEYAGPAPGFPGLDQVNVVLPAELDGVGTVTLTLGADSFFSNSVTFVMNALPAQALQVTGITLAQSEATGLSSIPAMVSLNGRAQGNGFPVVLGSSNPAIQVPGFVTVAAGSATAPFTVQATPVFVQQKGTIQASGNGSSTTASLLLDPANGASIASLMLNPVMVAGGDVVTATVSLSASAPGGAVIHLSSDNAAAQTPATVTVGLGQSMASFIITTSPVSSPVTANITAEIGGASQTVKLQISPPIALALSAGSVIGGTSVMGTITLGSPAPISGAIVQLGSNDGSAQVPGAGVVVTGGQTVATFPIQTLAVSSPHTATITASSGGNSVSAALTVSPVGAVTLESLSVSPSNVTGGTLVTATVTLTDAAPTTGITVLLRSSSPFAQLQQSFVAIPSGLNAATFTIQTLSPPRQLTVTIIATYQSVTQSVSLTIN